MPLPAAASGFSFAITENVRSNCEAAIDGADTLLELDPELGVLGDELHAALTTARLAAIDAQARFLVIWCKETTRFLLATCGRQFTAPVCGARSGSLIR